MFQLAVFISVSQVEWKLLFFTILSNVSLILNKQTLDCFNVDYHVGRKRLKKSSLITKCTHTDLHRRSLTVVGAGWALESGLG